MAQGGNAQLEVNFAVDPRRVRGQERRAPNDGWSAAASTAGQRAISVKGPAGGWALVPPAGLKNSVTAASHHIKQHLTVSPAFQP